MIRGNQEMMAVRCNLDQLRIAVEYGITRTRRFRAVLEMNLLGSGVAARADMKEPVRGEIVIAGNVVYVGAHGHEWMTMPLPVDAAQEIAQCTEMLRNRAPIDWSVFLGNISRPGHQPTRLYDTSVTDRRDHYTLEVRPEAIIELQRIACPPFMALSASLMWDAHSYLDEEADSRIIADIWVNAEDGFVHECVIRTSSSDHQTEIAFVNTPLYEPLVIAIPR